MRKIRGAHSAPRRPGGAHRVPALLGKGRARNAYPERLNITRALLEGALAKGFGARIAYHCKGRQFSYAAVQPRGASLRRCIAPARRSGRPGRRLRLEDSAELDVLHPGGAGDRRRSRFPPIRSCARRIWSIASTIAAPGSCSSMPPCCRRSSRCRALAHRWRHVDGRAERPDRTFVSLESLLDDGDPRVDLCRYPCARTSRSSFIRRAAPGSPRPPATLTPICSPRPILIATTVSACGTDDVVAGPPAHSVCARARLLRALYAALGSVGRAQRRQVAAGAGRRHDHVRGHHHCRRLDLLQSPGADHLRAGELKLPTLRIALCGGEPLPIEVERAWARATGKPLEQFLGTTELLNIFIGLRHGVTRPKPGAMGRPIPGYEVSIRDPETFEPVGRGAPGLLCVRGPTGTHYLNNPEAQCEAPCATAGMSSRTWSPGTRTASWSTSRAVTR